MLVKEIVGNDNSAELARLSAHPLRWDIFCKVVDNYGDIGVCWRLARQLANDHALRVTLWVDDLRSFRRIEPAVEIDRAAQTCEGVEIRAWQARFPDVGPHDVADVVIEAFGCPLPAEYVDAMVRRASIGAAAVWINLEHLSAETWVPSHHGLSSPHPRLPLTKYFFFPGFECGTGGLLAEDRLHFRRTEFRNSLAARNAFWRALGLEPPIPDEMRISLFAYSQGAATLAFPELLQAWADGPDRTTVAIPEGILTAELADFFGSAPNPGETAHRGALGVHVFAFLRQDDYDRLLWACDCNFVRGEDSFVRAQWAARPFVWQPYVQDDGAHLVKLEAFIDRYTSGWPALEAQALRGFWRDWNQPELAGSGRLASGWREFAAAADFSAKRADEWIEKMKETGDLAGNLIPFSEEKRRVVARSATAAFRSIKNRR